MLGVSWQSLSQFKTSNIYTHSDRHSGVGHSGSPIPAKMSPSVCACLHVLAIPILRRDDRCLNMENLKAILGFSLTEAIVGW